jgi:predicted RNase H-like nuclease (RuvC/YqgF family)
MKTQVTKTALPVDERFVSRSGVLQPNVAEIARIAEARMPEHQRAERLIDRTTLDDLENSIRTMEAHVTDREHSVRKLEPEVEAAEKRVERLKEDVAQATAAVAERMPGSREDAQHATRKLANAEEALTAVKIRLDISTRVLAATLAIQVEFFKVNGSRLAKLRKLTVRPRVGDRF